MINANDEMMTKFIKENKFINSKITRCRINSQDVSKYYKTIALTLLKDNKDELKLQIDETEKSLTITEYKRTTKFNIKRGDYKNIDGYHFCKRMNLSFQNKNSNQTLKEILHIVRRNKIHFKILIELENGNNIFYASSFCK
jgi:hypothetical protein